jgi:mRNA interferase RelE/StbE
MSECYKLRIPDEIVGLIRGLHPTLKKKVKAALFDITHNPYCGKALKAGLSGLRSFRIKKFRIMYRLLHSNEISIVALGPRKYIYEETFRIIKREEEKQLPGSMK